MVNCALTFRAVFLSLIVSLSFSLACSAQQRQLWGVTSTGGTYGAGSIFYLLSDGTGFTKVHDFSGAQGYPFASLTLVNGKLWGMTLGDERAGTHGSIFTIDLSGQNFQTLHVFSGTDGGSPLGELIEYQGKLWGMTNQGGTHNAGVIFSINADGTGYTKVHDFEGKQGTNPRNSLLAYKGGFYGTTSHGGKYGMGTIFSLKPDERSLKAIYHFEKAGGGEPESGLTIFQGKFWGMTARGAANNEGSLYSIDPNGKGFTNHHDFIYPSLGDLIVSDNQLWGMMSLRGEYNAGVIFTMGDEGFKAVHHFQKPSGRFPEGNLLESNGLLWGMTRFGGANDLGVLFSLTKSGRQFKKVFDFTQTSGGVPYGTLVEVSMNH